MKPKAIRAFEILSAENAALFHRLRLFGEETHPEAERDRSIVLSLNRSGPQTVPQLARGRGVSRQHVQTSVNSLRKLGVVELAANPAHKRSGLVQLTRDGKKQAQALRDREASVLAELDLRIPAKDLDRAASVLEEIREKLEQFPARK